MDVSDLLKTQSLTNPFCFLLSNFLLAYPITHRSYILIVKSLMWIYKLHWNNIFNCLNKIIFLNSHTFHTFLFLRKNKIEVKMWLFENKRIVLFVELPARTLGQAPHVVERGVSTLGTFHQLVRLRWRTLRTLHKSWKRLRELLGRSTKWWDNVRELYGSPTICGRALENSQDIPPIGEITLENS